MNTLVTFESSDKRIPVVFHNVMPAAAWSAAGAFKKENRTIPVSDKLPEGTRPIRVQPAAGDDSVQNPEQHIEMEYVYENGAIQFTSKTPALYLLIKK